MTEKYYQTNEVTAKLSQEFGDKIKPSKLFFYERQKLLSVKRETSNGYRLYSEKNIQDLKLIISFISAGISIDLVKKLLNKALTTSEFVEVAAKINNTDKAIPYAKETLSKYNFKK